MSAALAWAQPGGGAKTYRGADRAYEMGQRAIERQQWEEAAKAFSEAAASGSRADGALYWKAYALNKLGRRFDAATALATLLKEHSNSRWLDDAKALDLEMRQAAGQKPRPDAEPDTELKLMALNALMQSDPEKAIPYLDRILKSPADPKLKERALFVLAQSNSPRARDMLAQMARGGGNPDVQLKAINYLVIMGRKSPENLKLLSEIYASATDTRVKGAVLSGFMMARARDRLLEAAKSEKDADLRRRAVDMLGASGGTAELWTLYRSSTSPEEKKRLINGLMVGHDMDHLLEIARTETDGDTRRKAIQMVGVAGGEKAAPSLVGIYDSINDVETRRAVIDALMIGRSAKALVDLARKETNPELKRKIVERLSTMHSPEATEYMLELLK
jgi:tetratricopeptide (TPR) repeat protein